MLTLARDTSASLRRRISRAADRVRRGEARRDRARSSATTSRASSARAKGNVSEMARQSGMERHHVRAYLRKYGIDKDSTGT